MRVLSSHVVVLFPGTVLRVLDCSRVTDNAKAFSSSAVVEFDRHGETAILEPLAYNQQFMARRDDDDDEGTAVVGVEGIDVITRHKRVWRRDDLYEVAPVPFAKTVLSTTTFFTTLFSSLALLPELPQQEYNQTDSANSSLWYSDKDFEEDQAKPTPAWYAIISALVASIAYLLLFLTRCKGLLDELAPKKQLGELVLSRPDCNRRQRSRFKMGQGTTTRLCSGLFGKPDASAVATILQQA